MTTLVLLLAVLQVHTQPAEAYEAERGPGPEASSLDALEFMAGEWSATFETFGDTWGSARAGRAAGTVHGEFGPGRAWFELSAETTIAGSGGYAVRVLVHTAADRAGLDAFVVNSFGGSARYRGRPIDDSTLVFEGRFAGKIQRVRYERRGNRVRYYADESRDGGANYQPHTEAWWSRVTPPAAPSGHPHASTPRIAHVEITADVVGRAVRFYERVFGWSFEARPDQHGALAYWLGRAGPADDGTAVTAGIAGRDGMADQPVVTVYVDDLPAAAARIVAQGGTTRVPRFAIPGAGWLAYFSDTEGNRFAVFQSDPGAR